MSVWGRNPQPWILEGAALAAAQRARLDEIRRDNAKAAAPRPRLPWADVASVFALEWDGDVPTSAPARLGARP